MYASPKSCMPTVKTCISFSKKKLVCFGNKFTNPLKIYGTYFQTTYHKVPSTIAIFNEKKILKRRNLIIKCPVNNYRNIQLPSF